MLNRQMIPQLPIPSGAPFDFSQTAAPSVREIFPEPKPVDTRTFTQKLMELRIDLLSNGTTEAVAQCEDLLFRYSHLEKQITEFLATQRQETLARLEATRAELWNACRALEDAVGVCLREVGRLTAVDNSHARIVNEARVVVREATQPPFHTRFPNAIERGTWEARQTSARAALAKVIEEQNEITSALAAARARHAEAARELAERVEALRAADSAVIDFQKTK